MRIDGALVAVIIEAPDLIQKFLTRKRFAVITRKQEQQIALLGRERNTLVRNEHKRLGEAFRDKIVTVRGMGYKAIL